MSFSHYQSGRHAFDVTALVRCCLPAKTKAFPPLSWSGSQVPGALVDSAGNSDANLEPLGRFPSFDIWTEKDLSQTKARANKSSSEIVKPTDTLPQTFACEILARENSSFSPADSRLFQVVATSAPFSEGVSARHAITRPDSGNATGFW